MSKWIACFSMPYGDFNDLQGITSSNKSIGEAACNAPNNTQYDFFNSLQMFNEKLNKGK